MPDYAWPDAQHRTLIGARVTRVDAPAKVSGQAKYTYDVHRAGMLYGKVLRCPYAHAKVVSIDTSAAEKMPGGKAVHIVKGRAQTFTGRETMLLPSRRSTSPRQKTPSALSQ